MVKTFIAIIAFVSFLSISAPVLHAEDFTAIQAITYGKLEKGASYRTEGFIVQVGDGFVLLSGPNNTNFMLVTFEGDQMDSIGFTKGNPWRCKATFIGYKVLEMADGSEERMPLFQYEPKK